MSAPGLSPAILLVVAVALYAGVWLGLALARRPLRSLARSIASLPPARFVARLATRLRFLEARFNPAGVLGLHVTVGAAVVLLSAWLFAELADEIYEDEALTQTDVFLANWLYDHASPAFIALMKAVSLLGAWQLVLAASVALAIVFIARRNWRRLVELVLALPCGMLLNALVKGIFDRPRPSFDEPFMTYSSYSFPSGHTAAAALMWGFLAFLAVQRWRSWRARVSAVMGALLAVLLVGFSRTALGVHYLSDVIAAMALAAAWLAIVLASAETVVRRREWRRGRVQPGGRAGDAGGDDGSGGGAGGVVDLARVRPAAGTAPEPTRRSNRARNADHATVLPSVRFVRAFVVILRRRAARRSAGAGWRGADAGARDAHDSAGGAGRRSAGAGSGGAAG